MHYIGYDAMDKSQPTFWTENALHMVYVSLCHVSTAGNWNTHTQLFYTSLLEIALWVSHKSPIFSVLFTPNILAK